jgi:hypothetical protein
MAQLRERGSKGCHFFGVAIADTHAIEACVLLIGLIKIDVAAIARPVRIRHAIAKLLFCPCFQIDQHKGGRLDCKGRNVFAVGRIPWGIETIGSRQCLHDSSFQIQYADS